MKLFTKQDLSEMTGHTISKINHDRASGKLGGSRLGRSVVFTQREINAYKKGKKPPQTSVNLFSTRQAAQASGASVITIYRMVEDGRVTPHNLGDDDNPEYIFDQTMIEQIRETKNEPGRVVIQDGAYEMVDQGEDGRWVVKGSTGRDGKPLNYKTESLGVTNARRAIRKPLKYRKGDLVYAKVGAMVVRAVMQHDMTSICLAAWLVVNGTEKPVLVQKKMLKGVVNQEAIDHLQQHNYIIIKDGRDV